MNFALIATLGIASAIDHRYRKVPNLLTLPMALAGILFQTVTAGSDGFMASLAGFALGIALLYIPFALGGMGGGDVKLLAAIGAFVGPIILLHVFLASAVMGGVLSAVEITRSKAWRMTWEGLKYRMFYFLTYHRMPSETEVPFTSEPLRIPYAITMLCGYLSLCVLGGL
ncbi:MAG: A24 family peptidase [Candidatus Omnitrophota bacterium]|nr:A24 family peptidase [Candidatus Omnitrophota bacterium]